MRWCENENENVVYIVTLPTTDPSVDSSLSLSLSFLPPPPSPSQVSPSLPPSLPPTSKPIIITIIISETLPGGVSTIFIRFYILPSPAILIISHQTRQLSVSPTCQVSDVSDMSAVSSNKLYS